MKKHLIKIALTVGAIAGFSYASNAQISSTTLTVRDTTKAPTSLTASPTAICNGSTSTLTQVDGELGTNMEWKWSETIGGTSIGSGASVDVSPANTGTAPITKKYYLTAVPTATAGTNYCAYTRVDSIEITINPTPDITLPTNDTICTGTPLAYTVSSATSGTTISWSGGSTVGINDGTDVVIASGISGTASNTGTTHSTATISVTPKANGCTGSAETFQVTVLPKPVMTASNNDQTDCNGTLTDTVAFTTTATGGTVTYAWTRTTSGGTGVGASGSGTGISPFTATAPSTPTTCAQTNDTLEVVPTYTLGSVSCNGDPVKVAYKVNPTPTGTIATTAICEGETAQLTFTATCGTAPFDLGINTTSGTAATTANYTGITSGTAFDATPVPTATTTYYLWHITDANGCVNQATTTP